MKIYRVVTGYGVDEFGESNHEEEAKYFLNREKAEAFYKSGEYLWEETRITTHFKDGTKSVGYTGAMWFEREKKNARPYETVELVSRVYNQYRFEEIEVEE